jgi:hypothetical protein
MHLLGDTIYEVYRPATGVWVAQLSDTRIFPGQGEGTLIYRPRGQEDEWCVGIGLLIRRLHNRIAAATNNLVSAVPMQYLVDEDSFREDARHVDTHFLLINSLLELVYD